MAKKIESYTAHVQEGILLNANESTKNLSETILKEIAEELPSVLFNRYPDCDQTEILEAYAKAIGKPASQLLAGNGSDQMLGYLISTFLGKGKTLYTLTPDFSMYDYYASSYEADVERFALNEDGSFDIHAFIAEGKRKKADLVMFSNPNNPTGHCLSSEEVKIIANAFAPVPVVADEAYIEFSKEESAIALVDECKNLYVTRTLSKAYSLAGLRLGFLVTSEENMAKLKPAFVPYALNRMTMRIGKIVLSHAEEIQEEIEDVKRRRDALYEEVKEYQRVVLKNGQANFLYGKSAEKERLLALLKENNIVIRDYAGQETFRISIGTEEENQKVLQVLKQFEEEV